MIIRRKPASDDREFNDYIDTHVAERCRGPRQVRTGYTSMGTVKPSTVVAFDAQFGQEGGNRFSDIRIDINWDDIVQCVEKFADKGDARAIRLLPLIRSGGQKP